MQLGDEPDEQRHAHHAESARREQHARRHIAVACALQTGEVVVPAGNVTQSGGGQEQHGLGQRVGEDVQERRQQRRLCPHAQTHVDIADLGGGGIGHHGGQPLGADGGHGAHDHPGDAEDQQHRLDAAGGKHLDAHGAVDDLDQQQDIRLGHHAGQNTGGSGGGPSVGIRHPEVEREQTGLDGKTRRHQSDGYRHGEPVRTLGPQRGDGLVQLGEQQVSGDGIGVDDADQEQSGAHQREHHVPGRRDEGAAVVPGRQQGAGGDGADLNEHVAREDIVGVGQGQQGHQRQIHHAPVEMAALVGNVLQDAIHAAQHAQQHHHREQQRHQRLDDPGGDLVAPRGGEMAHHVGVAGVIAGAEPQHAALQNDGHGQQSDGQPPSPLIACHKGGHGAQQAQDDGEEGEVLDEAHTRPPFRRSDIITYSVSISSVWYFL